MGWRNRSPTWGGLLTLAVAFGACGEGETALLVEVTSPLAVPAEVDQLELNVAGEAGSMQNRTFDLAGPFPHSVSLRPGATDDETLVITVTGRKLSGALVGDFVVRRVLTTAFEPGVSKTVTVDLERACVGVTCPLGQDCTGGRCGDVVPPDSGGADAGSDAGGFDGGGSDAGPPDAGGIDAGPPPGDACPGATPLAAPGGRISVSLSPHAESGSCGGDGSEAVISVALWERSDLFVTTHAAGVDTVVYVRALACDGMEVGCNDDDAGLTSSALQLTDLPRGVYNVFVDTQAEMSVDVEVDIYATPTGAESDRCGHPTAIAAGTTTIAGDTCAFSHDYDLTTVTGDTNCPYGGAGDAEERVYYFHLPAATDVTVDGCNPMNTMDTAIYVRSSCEDASSSAQLGCNDDGCGGGSSCGAGYSSNQVFSLEAGLYYLFIDGYTQKDWSCPCGAYNFALTGI